MAKASVGFSSSAQFLPAPSALHLVILPSLAGGFLFEGLSDDEDDFHQVIGRPGQVGQLFWACFMGLTGSS